MISEEALVGISEELERVQRELRDALETSEKYRVLCVDYAKRSKDLWDGLFESHQEVKKRLFIVEEERDALRAWYKDAEKRLDRMEAAIKQHADAIQGQGKL